MSTKHSFKILTLGGPFILAVATTIAFAMLQPSGSQIANQSIVQGVTIGGWSIGAVSAIISLLIISVLAGVLKITRVHKRKLLAVIITLIGILPWLYVSWIISGEPKHTAIATGIIDFIARPLLWGSGISVLYTILVGLLYLPPRTQ